VAQHQEAKGPPPLVSGDLASLEVLPEGA